MLPDVIFFFFQAEDGIRDGPVTGVQTCALPISAWVFLAGRVARAQAGTPMLRTLVQVGDAAAAPGGVSSYEQVIGAAEPLPRAARGVDHWLMYTDRKSVV